MVGEDQHLVVAERGFECRVARVAGGGLGAIAPGARHVDSRHRQGDVDLRAVVTAMFAPLLGLRLQAVIDMDRTQLNSREFGLPDSACTARGIQATAQAVASTRLRTCSRQKKKKYIKTGLISDCVSTICMIDPVAIASFGFVCTPRRTRAMFRRAWIAPPRSRIG